VLIEHPAIAEAAVVPSPDPTRLAVPKAFVTLAEGASADLATAASVLAHCRSHLPPFKRVRRLEFSAELPKTVLGKIRRAELSKSRRALATGPSAAHLNSGKRTSPRRNRAGRMGQKSLRKRGGES
jgi:acetyl-CoA synthetase